MIHCLSRLNASAGMPKTSIFSVPRKAFTVGINQSPRTTDDAKQRSVSVSDTFLKSRKAR